MNSNTWPGPYVRNGFFKCQYESKDPFPFKVAKNIALTKG